MPAGWWGLRKSLECKSQRKEVYDPEISGKKSLSTISTKKCSSSSSSSSKSWSRSGCSRSIANLKDVVIHGSKRHTEKVPVCSPRSIGSSELLNPITHEVFLDESTCELKISSRSGGIDDGGFVGTLKQGTPGPWEGFYVGREQKTRMLGSPVRRTASSLSSRGPGLGLGVGTTTRGRSSFGGDSHGALFCHTCGEQFVRWEAVEAHHFFKHAVIEMPDSSRNVVEMICRAGCTWADNNHGGIDMILKVQNMQKTLAQFEEYREQVKIKASKLPKKHPRCLADGNELLRFHAATLECSLGIKGSCSLCTSEKCRVCRILRFGFSTKKELAGIGVFTASTSSKAFESIEMCDNDPCLRKALIVCRVIAGRVHRPLENVEEMAGQWRFDSLSGKVGVDSSIEELYLLSHRALLPCFVVIYKA